MGALQHDGLFVCARAVRVENVQIWGGRRLRYEFFYAPDGSLDLGEGHYEDAARLRFCVWCLQQPMACWSWSTEANLWEVAVCLARGRHAAPPSDGWKYLVAPTVRVGV